MNALLLSAVLAATPITLDQVRQESRNNLQGLLSELDRVRASEQTKLSRSVLFPQLSVQAQANRTITSTYSGIGTVVVQDANGNPVLGPNGQIQYQHFRAHHRNIKLRGIRVHTGIVYTGNAWRALVGTDIEVSDRFVIYADWISSASNAVSVGGVFVISQHDSVQASLLRANDQDRLSGVLIAVTHTFDLAHPLVW